MSRSRPSFPPGFHPGTRNAIVAGIAFLLAACSPAGPPHAQYLPLAELEGLYGTLITTANHPTADQHGTGDRIGLFMDARGTVWGLPLRFTAQGTVLGCAPPGLHEAKSTDTYPAGATIVGATNAPTGWRGGTGELELVYRGPDGGIGWRSIRGLQMTGGPVCWAEELPGPVRALDYYRLDRAADSR